MTENVRIRQFDLTDRDALLSFLREAYPDEPRKSKPDFWEWHFLENPHVRRDDCPLWILTSEKQIVGQLATMLVELKVGGVKTTAIWILDFVVHPQFRGRGLGKQLVLEAQKFYPTMITLGINEQSIAVFRSLKWTPLGSIHRYHKLLFPGEALREIARIAPLRELLNLSYAPFQPRFGRWSLNASGRLREVARFDASFDDLWHRASTQWPCAVVRSSRFLEWQFTRQPGKKYDILGLYEDDRLLGYVVMYFRRPERLGGGPPKAALSDLCYDAGASLETIDELLAGALRLALEKRAGSLVIDILDQRVEERLRRLGFWRIKTSPQFMASAPKHLELIYDTNNWFLTRSDSDVSIFEAPNL